MRLILGKRGTDEGPPHTCFVRFIHHHFTQVFGCDDLFDLISKCSGLERAVLERPLPIAG